MENAGLTHGGFYRHFRDKDELYAEAVRWFLCEAAPKPWRRPRRNAHKLRAEQIVDAYFSLDHFDDHERCCPLIALPPDTTHGGDGVKAAYQDVLEKLLALLQADLAGPQARERALSRGGTVRRRPGRCAQRGGSRPGAGAAPSRLPPGANYAKSPPMLMFDIPFGTTDWEGVERTEHAGETGKAYWRTRNFNNIRVRMVEYTPGYLADHWCQKGHVLLVLDGELHTELADGRTVVLKKGQLQVADGDLAHRSRTDSGAKLFIVD